MKKLTTQQKYLYQGLILGPGLLALYCIDKFGDRLTKYFVLDGGYILCSTFVVITAMTILASRHISRTNAKWTAVIASIFETAVGQRVLLESTNQPQPWPPAYFLTIILFAVLFLLYGGFINLFVRQKYSD